MTWWRRFFVQRAATAWERPEEVVEHPFRPAIRMTVDDPDHAKWDWVLRNAIAAVEHFNQPCPRRLGWSPRLKAAVSRIYHGNQIGYNGPMWDQKITFCCPDEWACIEKADSYLPLKWRIEWEKRRQALNQTMIK